MPPAKWRVLLPASPSNVLLSAVPLKTRESSPEPEVMVDNVVRFDVSLPRIRVSLPTPTLMDSARSKKANRSSAILALPVIRVKEEVNGGAVVG